MLKNDLIKTLAMASYNLWKVSLHDDATYKKLTDCKINDVIMEIASLNRRDHTKNNYSRRIGTLIDITDDFYVINDLSGKRTEWRRVKGQTQFISILKDF